MATDKDINDVFDSTVRAIKQRLASDDCNASDIKNAVDFLKAHPVTPVPADPSSILTGADAELPFPIGRSN